MTTNKHTEKGPTPGNTGYSPDDWSALILVSSSSRRPIRRKAATPAARMTGAEIERADLEAARQLGVQRRLPANMTGQPGVNGAKVVKPGYGWLKEDPRQWRGRKIRSRNNQGLYVVRQVFNSGRVELEKTFMLYNSDVDTIRKDFEPA